MARPAVITAGLRAVRTGARVLRTATAIQAGLDLTTDEIIKIQQGELGGRGPGPTRGRMFEPGADQLIESQGLPQGTVFKVDEATGELVIVKRRRRRKRLLTCGDKADLAFLIGQLGKGATAQSAISSLLSKCG